ncbi:hypothetical protein BDZ85DRAFT_248168 [Elsinoe ampelina]|uniref:Core domain-containing protein n=1 Tax=Elsinoe ampelina TaxID=302913 RepID=A0A6A6GG87_9PEZI|nr:hypothetical protein BDZ85DRAFT_248168 [Elsinoe ampelina]
MAGIVSSTSPRVLRPLSARYRHLSQTTARYACTRTSHPYHNPSTPQSITHLSIGRSFPRESVRSLSSPSRSFSTTTYRSVRAITNPRKDDDGNEMLVDITPRAAGRLHAIAEKDNKPSTCLRVTVESGGCHGFQYIMSLTTLDDVSPEEDTVFQSEDGKNAKVVMDEPSLELLKGSKIDYTMELIGSQFKVTGIPGAKSSCGCGTSFDIQA